MDETLKNYSKLLKKNSKITEIPVLKYEWVNDAFSYLKLQKKNTLISYNYIPFSPFTSSYNCIIKQFFLYIQKPELKND